jgi:adenylate cyclase
MLLYNFTERRKLKNLFSAYVPQTIVEQLLASPDLVVGVSPEKRVLTVMFADVLGFSRIAEALPPESLASYMNRVFDVMTRAVYENGGTVDKYMGDAIMAFWGAPLPDENHAQNAVKAALDLHRELNKLSAEFKLASNPGVEVGVGINTGEMVVGDIGSSYRHTYTVIGDSVNQAARLQELTRQHKLPILLGQETVALLPAGAYESQLRSLGLMPMQGRKEPVMIFALQVGKNVKK